MLRVSAVGSPETVQGVLKDLLNDTAADEFVATAPIYDARARQWSVQQAAGIFQTLVMPETARTGGVALGGVAVR